MITNKKAFTGITLLIVAAAMCRLIPHWPNFTPIVGMALFGGAMFGGKWFAAAVPLAAMLLSDLALGAVLGWNYAFHSTQWMVYLSVAGIALMGSLFNKSNTQLVFLGGTISGLLFFLTTNFAVWLAGGMYPMTIEGLGMSYAAGLAFYRDGGNFLLNGVLSAWITTASLLAVNKLMHGVYGKQPVTASVRTR